MCVFNFSLFFFAVCFGLPRGCVKDVAIVRQLLENFVDAAGQARYLLAKAAQEEADEGTGGKPSEQLSWTLESARRLLDKSGAMLARTLTLTHAMLSG